MIICIGPVCIPLWGLFPFILVLFTKGWNKLKAWYGLSFPIFLFLVGARVAHAHLFLLAPCAFCMCVCFCMLRVCVFGVCVCAASVRLGFGSSAEEGKENKQEDASGATTGGDDQSKVAATAVQTSSSAADEASTLRLRKPDKYKQVLEIDSPESFDALMKEAVEKGWC